MPWYEHLLAWLSQALGPVSRLFVIVLSPKEEMFLLYPLTVIPLTIYAYCRYHKSAHRPFSVKRFLRFLFPRRILLHRSSRLDYRFFLLNLFVFASLSAVVASGLQVVFPWTTQKMVALFGPQPPVPDHIPWLAIAGYVVCSFSIMDLMFYLVHYAFHKVPWLWEFHKVHHSPVVLNPLTAYRGHPLNVIVSLSLQITFIDLTAGVFDHFYPGIVGKSLLLGTNALTIASHALGGYLRHSNVWLHFGRKLNHIISAPAHHHIHHSSAPQHWDKNLAGLLAIWDWIFGTLYVPDARERLNFGLGAESAEYSTVPRLYFLPFQKLWKNHLKPAAEGLPEGARIPQGAAQPVLAETPRLSELPS